jgi:hypothetical protein
VTASAESFTSTNTPRDLGGRVFRQGHASVTGLARVVYGAEQPSDAQRAAVRRAVRRLEAGGHVEAHRLRVGRTYAQQRAHPRFWPPRYDRRLAVCTGKDGCPGCAAGDRPSMYFTADVVAMFIEHYGTLTEADRQLWRATAHGWHLYPVPLPGLRTTTARTKLRSPNCACGGP